MTRLIIISFALLISSRANSQNKQDYYWPFGKDQIQGDEFGASEIDFTMKPLTPSARTAGLEFDQNNASICDAEGNLLFYSNGCAVANRLHEMMPNGDSINSGIFFDTSWRGDCAGGYPGQQNITILPDPSNNDGYYILTVPTSVDTIINKSVINKMKYSYVDMRQDNGYGDVIEKNVIFHEGSLLSSYLTSISHANGKDWWIVNPVNPLGYIVYLLDETGISYSSIETDHVWDDFYSCSSGDARFSPDGSKYALFNRWDDVLVYDFDRNTGELSNERMIPWSEQMPGIFTSCEWSPNSRFLYLMQFDSLFQLDTWAEPLEEGLAFIAENNGIPDPRITHFQKSALGPDCRIYIRTLSSSYSFHVIHKPDEQGTACDFVQQAIRLPHVTAVGSFPNFPRFRVDEEEKCDPSIVSILGEDIYWRRDLRAYPNPTPHFLFVERPEQLQGDIFIIDMSGNIVLHKQQLTEAITKLDLSHLPVGIYSVEFVPRDNKDRVVYTVRVSKV